MSDRFRAAVLRRQKYIIFRTLFTFLGVYLIGSERAFVGLFALVVI